MAHISCWKAIAGSVAVLFGLWLAAPVHASETYKIGGLFAVTGPASFLGDPEKKSMESAIRRINQAGGIDGRMLEAVIYDTEGDPTKAVMGAGKLINKDQVIAIVGPSTTPTSLAVMPLTGKAGIPLISCAAGVKITTPVKPAVFKTAQSDVLAVNAIYHHMQKQGIKKIALLSVSNAFGESGREQLEKQAVVYGLTVVQQEKFGEKDTDMTAQLTKIRTAGADAIVCWGTNPGPAVAAKNFRQLGMDLPLYQSHGVASPKFIELAGEAADGIILPTGKVLVAELLPASDPHRKVLQEYATIFREDWNLPVSGFGGYAWDAMNILATALKGTGGDRAKLGKAIESINGLVGVTGTFRFGPEDHNGLGEDAFVLVRIEKGRWVLVP